MRPPLAVVLAFGLCPGLLGDPPAPAVPSDSIAAAKKDFAAIKAESATPEGISGLPTIGVKDDDPASSSQQMVVRPVTSDDMLLDSSRRKPGTTGNWLVDAMEKKDDKSPASRQPDELLRAEVDFFGDAAKADGHGSKEGQGSPEAHAKAASKDLSDQVLNPLESFMAGWVSPRDHDLLVPSTKGDMLVEADTGKARADVLPTVESASAGITAQSLLAGSDSGAESKSEANPYIAIVDPAQVPAAKTLVTPEPAAIPLLDLSDSPKEMTTSGAEAHSIDTSKAFVPDFAQPDDDDKYFPQLKRF